MKMILACMLTLALAACATAAQAPPVDTGVPPVYVPPVDENPSLIECALTQPIWQCALQMGLPYVGGGRPYTPPMPQQ